MKYKIIISIVIFAGLMVAYLSHFSIYGNRIRKVKIKNIEFRAETVSSSEKMAMGLGGRKNLCANCAMLFVFPREGKYEFWMKDMNFDLDIIWIRENEITKIARNVSKNNPDLISPDIDSDKVLEINAGLADRYGFEAGDEVRTTD